MIEFHGIVDLYRIVVGEGHLGYGLGVVETVCGNIYVG
jgi:hypothetical protein